MTNISDFPNPDKSNHCNHVTMVSNENLFVHKYNCKMKQIADACANNMTPWVSKC